MESGQTIIGLSFTVGGLLGRRRIDWVDGTAPITLGMTSSSGTTPPTV
jgi:hypothetical protein